MNQIDLALELVTNKDQEASLRLVFDLSPAAWHSLEDAGVGGEISSVMVCHIDDPVDPCYRFLIFYSPEDDVFSSARFNYSILVPSNVG